MSKINNNYFGNTDIILSSSTIIFLSIIYFIKNFPGRMKYFVLTLSVAVIAANVVYLLMRGKTKNEIPIMGISSMISNNLFFKKLILSIFITIYTFTVYILYINLYNRPLIYFVMISILCVLIILQILLINKKGRYTYIILTQIILLSLNLRMGLFYEFPDIIGDDTIYHLNLAKLIENSGYIPTGFAYSAHPVMQLFIAISQIITQFSEKGTLAISILFGMAVLIPLFTFLVGKKIFNVDIALVSSLFVSITNYLIWYSYSIFATSMGLIYVILMLFFIRSEKKTNICLTFLLLLFYFIIILTHTLTSLITLYIILVFYLLIILYNNTYKYNEYILTKNTVLLFTLSLIAYWMFTGYIGNTSFFDLFIKTIINKLSFSEISPITFMEVNLNVKWYQEVFNLVGNALVISLAFIGGLYLLKVRKNIQTLIYSQISFLILFLAFIGLAFGLNDILPERWLSFASMLFVFPSSVGLIILNNYLLKNKNSSIILTSSIVFLLAFFMITSSIANPDNPIYSKNISYRTSYLQSELDAARSNLKFNNGTILTDMSYMRQQVQKSNIPVTFFYENISLSNVRFDELIVLRSYAIENRIDIPSANPTGTLPSNINNSFIKELSSFKANSIYDNGKVKTYIRRDYK